MDDDEQLSNQPHEGVLRVGIVRARHGLVQWGTRHREALDAIDWIQRSQLIDPKNARPELGVTDQDTKDIAACLCTLRTRITYWVP